MRANTRQTYFSYLYFYSLEHFFCARLSKGLSLRLTSRPRYYLRSHKQSVDFLLNWELDIQVRALVTDYCVIITIVIFVLIDSYFSLSTPKLTVPTEFKVSFYRDSIEISRCISLLVAFLAPTEGQVVTMCFSLSVRQEFTSQSSVLAPHLSFSKF